MNILGISCHYHDSSACLIKDGRVISAAQEERFNRKKYSPEFPINAINYCLQEGGITVNDIDSMVFYEKPFLKFSRVILSHLKEYPFSMNTFMANMPQWLQDRLIMPIVIKRETGYQGKIYFVKHHLSHAASTFLVSPFEEAAILTSDGVGEYSTITLGMGKKNDIKIIKELHFPDSLGLVYTAVTTYLGFKALEGEGKVMGLAGYGKPEYLDLFNKIVPVNEDGSFSVDDRYFAFNRGNRMYTKEFIKMFGKDRAPGEELDKRHWDIAASLQKFVEDTTLKMANHLYEITKSDNICLAGGLFLNCVLNQKIIETTQFKNIFVQPSAGDTGGALGAAAYVYNTVLKNDRKYVMENAYLGPSFSKNSIKNTLVNSGLRFHEVGDAELFSSMAKAISQQKVVAWFQGRMEFGPRALGNRSILADPRNPEMKDILNKKIKFREPFRPYAPVVLEEKAKEYFELKDTSPFMLLAPQVKKEKTGVVPAITHVDGTARVQTVNRNSNPRLYSLIKEFENITGVPMLINTSFNLNAEPIVCSPQDAVNSFKRSKMDYMVIENFVVER